MPRAATKHGPERKTTGPSLVLKKMAVCTRVRVDSRGSVEASCQTTVPLVALVEHVVEQQHGRGGRRAAAGQSHCHREPVHFPPAQIPGRMEYVSCPNHSKGGWGVESNRGNERSSSAITVSAAAGAGAGAGPGAGAAVVAVAAAATEVALANDLGAVRPTTPLSPLRGYNASRTMCQTERRGTNTTPLKKNCKTRRATRRGRQLGYLPILREADSVKVQRLEDDVRRQLHVTPVPCHLVWSGSASIVRSRAGTERKGSTRLPARETFTPPVSKISVSPKTGSASFRLGRNSVISSYIA